MALWTPVEITTALWLDSDDAATITESGGVVSQWNDKSGNSRNFNQTTAALKPAYTTNALNGKPVISFAGDCLTSMAALATWKFLHDATGSSIFAVWKAGNTANPDTFYPLLVNNGTSATQTGVAYYYEDGGAVNDRLVAVTSRAVTNQPTSDNRTANNTHPANTPALLSIIGDPANATAADRSKIYIHGVGPTTNNTFANAASTSNPSYNLQLGAIGNSTYQLTGYIAEVIIISGIASTDNRQKIEGYLAWKWGLVAGLPADHPYKSAAPTIPGAINVTLSLDQPCSLLSQFVTLSLDQPIALRKLLTLSLDQSCGMELAMTLIQRCRAMPTVTMSLNQWVRSLRRVTLRLDQHVGVCPLVRLSFDQRVRMPGRVTLSLDQAVVIAGQRLTLSLDQPIRMDRNGRVTLSLAQPCAIADGTAIRQRVLLAVTVGGRVVDPDFVSIKADDADGFMSATIRFPDFQQYLLCRVGEEVVITELLDDLPAEITILEVRTLTNPEEPGAADHILTAVSPTAALDEEPLTDDLGPGVASTLMTALVAGYGFTLDWQGVAGWPFKAGELMAEDETAYAVLVRLAAASGAFVQSLPDGETIRLRPEYAKNVGDWPTAVCDLEINDQDHIFSIDEQPDERDGFNAFLVSGQSAAAGNHRLDDIALTATTKDVRFYQWPWDSAATIILGHTGGDWVSIDYLGVFEELVKDEEVVITAGIGQLQLPCYSLVSYRYKEDGLGLLKAEEDGSVTTAQLGDALLDVTYNTKFRKWLLTDPKAEHLQIYIDEVI